MATAETTSQPNYREWNANKLRFVLNSTRKQIDKFEDAIVKTDKQLSVLMKKCAEYRQKEVLLRQELDLKLPIPNEETRKALDDDFVVAQGISHKEFMESLENEAD